MQITPIVILDRPSNLWKQRKIRQEYLQVSLKSI